MSAPALIVRRKAPYQTRETTMGIYDVPPAALVEKTAIALKAEKELQPPPWAMFVKTGTHKERPPVQEDWWHLRAASVLCRLAKRGPVGVSKLRAKYGGSKRRGMKPNATRLASGSILRKILQQLEKAGLAQQSKNATRKGRVATSKAFSLLNKQSQELMKSMGITIPARPKTELKIAEPEKPRKRARKSVAKAKTGKQPRKRTPRKKAAKKKTAAVEKPAAQPALPAEKEAPKSEDAPKGPQAEAKAPAPETSKTEEKPAPEVQEKPVTEAKKDKAVDTAASTHEQ